MTAPLRIGILGAAGIADDGIVAPARALGDIRSVDLVLETPAPPASDPCWSAELAAELIGECYRQARLAPRGI